MPNKIELTKLVLKHVFKQLTATKDQTLQNIISFTLISYNLIEVFHLYTLAHISLGFWYILWFGVLVMWRVTDEPKTHKFNTVMQLILKWLYSLNSIPIAYTIMNATHEFSHNYIVGSIVVIAVIWVMNSLYTITYNVKHN